MAKFNKTVGARSGAGYYSHYSPVTKFIEKCTGDCAYGQNSTVTVDGREFVVLHAESEQELMAKIENYEAAEAKRLAGASGFFGTRKKKEKQPKTAKASAPEASESTVSTNESVSAGASSEPEQSSNPSPETSQEYWDKKVAQYDVAIEATKNGAPKGRYKPLQDLVVGRQIAKTGGPKKETDEIFKLASLSQSYSTGDNPNLRKHHEEIERHVSNWNENDKKVYQDAYREEQLVDDHYDERDRAEKRVRELAAKLEELDKRGKNRDTITQMREMKIELLNTKTDHAILDTTVRIRGTNSFKTPEPGQIRDLADVAYENSEAMREGQGREDSWSRWATEASRSAARENYQRIIEHIEGLEETPFDHYDRRAEFHGTLGNHLKEERAVNLGAEFGFNDETLHPALKDVDWKQAGAFEEADKAEEQWVNKYISEVRKEHPAAQQMSESDILKRLAKDSADARLMSMARYRQMRQAHGRRDGEVIDGGDNEMDDDYMDARDAALDEALFRKHADMREERGD